MVKIGSRFVASKESSAHVNFKNKVVSVEDGDTDLTLKELTAVRLIKMIFTIKFKKHMKKTLRMRI